MSEFEKWFMDQDFYTNMRFIHGVALFTKDGDVYRVLPVQMTHVAWVEKQSEIDELKKQLNTANFFKKGDDSTIENATKVMNEMRGQIQKVQKERDQLKAERAGFYNKIKSQIETLKSASQSVIAYTERERNILQSQVDDLERILRGEHE